MNGLTDLLILISESVSVFVCLCVCLSVFAFVCLSVRLSVCAFVCLSLRLSVCLFVCLSVSAFVCLCLSVSSFVCLSLRLSVCRSLYLSLPTPTVSTGNGLGCRISLTVDHWLWPRVERSLSSRLMNLPSMRDDRTAWRIFWKTHSLVGRVVKASASRAGDLGLIPAFTADLCAGGVILGT